MWLIGFINIFRTLLFERQIVGVNKERNSCLILFPLFLSWILHSELFFTRKGGKRINLHTQHTTEKHVRCFHQMFCHVLRISPFLREKVKKIYCRYGISLGDFDKNHSRNSPERTKPFHVPFFIWLDELFINMIPKVCKLCVLYATDSRLRINFIYILAEYRTFYSQTTRS